MSKNAILSNVVMFAVGAAVGSAVTWKFVKTKYERIAQEEIESVKETYSKRAESDEQLEKLENGLKKTIDNMQKQIDAYEHANLVRDSGYTNYAVTERKVIDVDRPYVIDQDEYDTLDDYESEELLYYSDGVLADYYGDIVDDVDDMVGLDNLKILMEDDDVDSVYIRNDSRRFDYEVLLDLRSYSEAHPNGPHQAEV